MEPLTALSSLTGRTISIARARRSIRIASPDLAAAFRRRRRHKVVRDSCLVRDVPVEPGEPQHESFSSHEPGQTKTRAFRTAHCLPWAGDPQTYALLHCSVFKERTLPPSPFRTGSLTAPKGLGVGVNEGYSITACLPCQHPTTRYSPRRCPHQRDRQATSRSLLRAGAFLIRGESTRLS